MNKTYLKNKKKMIVIKTKVMRKNKIIMKIKIKIIINKINIKKFKTFNMILIIFQFL